MSDTQDFVRYDFPSDYSAHKMLCELNDEYYRLIKDGKTPIKWVVNFQYFVWLNSVMTSNGLPALRGGNHVNPLAYNGALIEYSSNATKGFELVCMEDTN